MKINDIMANQFKIIKKECPHCHEMIESNIRGYANHVRWCKDNPQYEEIRKSTIDKLKSKTNKKYHTVKCEVCGKEYKVFCTDYMFDRKKYNRTCSKTCARKLVAIETKEYRGNRISESLKGRRYIVNFDGTKTLEKTKTPVEKKICKFCGNEYVSKRKYQEFCSVICASRYRYMNREEEELYRSQCLFRFSLNQYKDEFDFYLIKSIGWYKATNHGNNLSGVSRDHMFSIKEGYRQCIDPYIISHPANCKLLSQADNFRKRDLCSITILELMERIKKWEEKHGKYENVINYYGLDRFKQVE